MTFPLARIRCPARLWHLLAAVLALSLTAGAACHSTDSATAAAHPPPSSDAAVVLLFDGHGTSPGDVTALKRILSESHVGYSTADSPRLEGMSESELSAYRLLSGDEQSGTDRRILSGDAGSDRRRLSGSL